MSWTSLPARAPTTGRPKVIAYVRVVRDGTPRLSLFLSSFLVDKLGATDGKVDVQFGSGENAGCLRIIPDGEHKITASLKGAGRLTLPAFEGLPQVKTPTETAHLIKEAAGEIIIRLPVAEWEIAASRQSAPPVKAPIPRVANPPAMPSKLDMAEYLAGKGYKISRLAAGFFSVDGERVSALSVLEIVNKSRSKSDLPALATSEVW